MIQIPRSHILTQDLDEETKYASLTHVMKGISLAGGMGSVSK